MDSTQAESQSRGAETLSIPQCILSIVYSVLDVGIKNQGIK